MNFGKTCICFILSVFPVAAFDLHFLACNNYKTIELTAALYKEILKGRGTKGMKYLGAGKCTTVDNCKTLCANTKWCNFFGAAVSTSKNGNHAWIRNARLFFVNFPSYKALVTAGVQKSTNRFTLFKRPLLPLLKIHYFAYMCQNSCNYEHSDKVISFTTMGVDKPKSGITLLSSPFCKTVDECKTLCKYMPQCNYFTRDSTTAMSYLYKIAFSYAPLNWEVLRSFDSYFCNSGILPEHFTHQQVLDTLFWAALDSSFNNYRAYSAECRFNKTASVCRACRPSPITRFCMNTARSFIGSPSLSNKDTEKKFARSLIGSASVSWKDIQQKFFAKCAVEHPDPKSKNNKDCDRKGLRRRRESCDVGTPCDQFYDTYHTEIMNAVGMCELAYQCCSQGADEGTITPGFIPHCCNNNMYFSVQCTLEEQDY